MIIKNGKTISSIYKGSQVIEKIMKGTLVVYESFKNLVASGVPLTLLNCKGVDLVDYKLYGESVQPIDTSNIWDGTYTKGSYYDDAGNIAENSDVSMTDLMELKYNKYDITSVVGVNTNFNFRYNFFDENKTWLSQIMISVTTTTPVITTVDVPVGAKYINFSVYTSQIEKGQQICASEEAVPTPEFPIEIESVGERTKNLLPINDNLTTSYSDLSLSIENDVITLNGTVNINTQWGLYQDNGKLKSTVGVVNIEKDTPSLMSLKAGTYRLSLKYLGGTFELEEGATNKPYFGLYTYKNGVSIIDTRKYMTMSDYSHKITVTEDTDVQFFILQFTALKNAITFNNYKIKVQLEEGATATDYEPYGYKIAVKVSGKNLCSKFYERSTINTSNGETAYSNMSVMSDFIEFDEEKKYTISNVIPQTMIAFYNSDKVYLGRTYNHGESTFTFGKNSIYAKYNEDVENQTLSYIRFHTGSTGGLLENLGNVQLEEGSVATEYEPYHEPMTTNIYVNEPLRKVENHADYIDFKKGKIYRYIKTYDITGEEAWKKALDGNLYTRYYSSFTTDVLGDRTTNNGMCNILNSVSFDELSLNLKECIATWYQSDSSRTRIDICLSNDRLTTADELMVWLKANPVKLIYFLLTPAEETIELPNIPTFKGTTILEVDTTIQPSNLEVVYKGKGNNQILSVETNSVLNSILGSDTETEIDITNTEINEILDEIIGG
jgi:hypothetical protein